MESDGTGWDRVAEATRARRLELGLTQQAAAERAGISLATWRLVESAGRRRYQDLTLRRLCRALGWRADAVTRLVAADVPLTELRNPSPDPPGRTEDASEIPAGLARKWTDLSAQEQSMVQGFIDGLLAGRDT